MCTHTYTYTQKAAHTNIYSSFIHNYSILEVTKISFSRQMDELWYIQTMEYYATIKRNSQNGRRHEVTLNACS